MDMCLYLSPSVTACASIASIFCSVLMEINVSEEESTTLFDLYCFGVELIITISNVADNAVQK